MKPLKLILSLLLLTSLTFTSKPQKSTSLSYGFIENEGQIINQNNKLNRKEKCLFNGMVFNVQLKGKSFSYDVYKIENNNQKFVDKNSVDSDKKLTYNFHRIDIF